MITIVAARERSPAACWGTELRARIALVSDAGTPLVSDPGFKLVREAIEEDISVHAIPGASAVLTGLAFRPACRRTRFSVRGLFWSSRAGERDAVLSELKALRATLIFFESAQRLSETLAAMTAMMINGVRMPPRWRAK